MLDFQKIQVGTKVRLRSKEDLLLEVPENDEILEYAGQVVTIVNIDNSDEELTTYGFGGTKPYLVDADIEEIL